MRRDGYGEITPPLPGAKDTSELVAMGVAFRQEFDDVVFLQTRHRLVDEHDAKVEEDSASRRWLGIVINVSTTLWRSSMPRSAVDPPDDILS